MFAVGAAITYNPHLFDEANTSLSLQIFGNATSPFHRRAGTERGAPRSRSSSSPSS
jgi:hypothetical protein